MRAPQVLREYSARIALGIGGSSALSEFGMCALELGFDSPALLMLAGLDTDRRGEMWKSYRQALLDLGLEEPDRRTAIMTLARSMAGQIVNRKIEPIAGAKEIWHLTRLGPDLTPRSLQPFVYWASEAQDRPQDEEFIRHAIIASAQDLLSA